MKYIVTGKEMKLLDENTTAYFGVPSEVLMEQAAEAFVQELFLLPENFKSVVVLCGIGNNAGDGVVIARLLNQRGIPAKIYLCSDKVSGLFEKQLNSYRAFGFEILESLENEDCDLIVDAIFGTGLSRDVEGTFQTAIEWANSKSAVRVAVDIPSGVSADDGHIYGCAMKADYTVTFSFEKVGHYLYPGAEYTGQLILCPIEITEKSMKDSIPKVLRYETSDIYRYLPKRKADSHKGTYGKLLVIAGSKNMAGAAFFSAIAAYRCGCGLVKIFTEESNRIALQQMIPEAILSTYDENMSKEEFEQLLDSELDWGDAVLIGPGLGTKAMAKQILSRVLSKVSVPLVMDADALNLLSNDQKLMKQLQPNMAVTPHLGEMSRLINQSVSEVKKHMLSVAREFANKYHVICHLKDATSVTATGDGNLILQTEGNHGMATAGSGDVLAGIIASLLSQGVDLEYAVAIGAKIHAQAGDAAAKKVGRCGLMARDIIDGLTYLEYFR